MFFYQSWRSSAMGILFASIPTGHPGEVINPLNFFRIPLVFVSRLFIPLDAIPQAGLILAFLSPLTYTLDLVRTAVGKGGASPIELGAVNSASGLGSTLVSLPLGYM